MPRLRLLFAGPLSLALAAGAILLYDGGSGSHGAAEADPVAHAASSEIARHAVAVAGLRVRSVHPIEHAKIVRHDARKPKAVALPVGSPWSLPPMIDIVARPGGGSRRALSAGVLRSRRVALSPAARASVRAGRVSTGALRLLYRLPKAGGPYLVFSAESDRIRAVQTTLWMTRNAVTGLLALPRNLRPARLLLEPQAGDRTLTAGPPKAKAGRLCSLVPIYRGAAAKYHQDWRILAAINRIETNLGRNLHVSSAGAVGWMQFMPGTWRRWGVDASGDGLADPWNPEDAIFSAGRYLDAAGYQNSPSRSIFAYNHAMWYVNDVLRLAKQLSPDYHC